MSNFDVKDEELLSNTQPGGVEHQMKTLMGVVRQIFRADSERLACHSGDAASPDAGSAGIPANEVKADEYTAP